MELLCGGCGRTLSVDDTTVGSEQLCPYCGRGIRVAAPGARAAAAEQEGLLRSLAEDEDLADEFLTKARLALKKKLLVVCGTCGERLTVEQRLAGKVARCPACGGQIRIPAPSSYGEPLKPEELMTEAESPKEVLDVADPSSGSGRTEEAEAPAAAPHRSPPPPEPLPPRPSALRRARVRPKRGMRARTLLALVMLAMALAALGGAVAGYLLVRQEARRGGAEPARPEAKTPRIERPVPREVSTAPRPAAAAKSGSDTQERRSARAVGAKMEVTGARLTALGGGGFVPAPLNKAFLEVEVRMTAGGKEIGLDTAGGDVVLATPSGDVRALGIAAAGGAVPSPARPGAIAIPSAAARVESFVFLVPAKLTGGTLRMAALGSAPLPHLPRRPPLAAAAIVGKYAEARRHLKLSFADPIMELLRSGPRHRLVVTAEKVNFRIAISPAPVQGMARPVGDGVYAAVLGYGSVWLKCHVRVVEPGKRLILYLADRPYHQIIFQKQ